MSNSLEVDFLAVGNGEKSGDAIAMRWGDFSDANKQFVVVIDGGTKESGEKLVELIKNTYNTSHVGLLICTHPDGDHASGLRVVLEKLSVSKIWMHQPWNHSDHIRHMFQDGRITANSLSDRLKEAFNFAHEIQEIAEKQDITIEEPFAGKKISGGGAEFTILGPSRDYYRSLIPDFDKSPVTKAATSILGTVKEAVKWVAETLHIETLGEDGETSAVNNSSLITHLAFDTKQVLFTGDAGIPAMKKALDYADAIGVAVNDLSLFQVPHHGSKRNVSPSILNRIKAVSAYISAAEKAEKHPAKKVVNACIRRGMGVYSTEGKNILHRQNAPIRAGYSAIEPLAFSEMVEE